MGGREDRREDTEEYVQRERLRRKPGPARPSPVSSRQSSILENPAALKRDAHEPDFVILVTVIALTAIGILMVYSANQNTFQLVAPQVIAGLLGFVAMVILMRVDYRYLRIASVPLAVLALALLIVVLVPLPGPLKELSVSHNGSARWLHLGP
jgi:cell division protein FtsW